MLALKYFLVTIVFCFGLISPTVLYAQNIFLGNFSKPLFLAQIPQSLNLEIKDTQYNLSHSEISNWLKEQTDLIYNTQYNSEIEQTNFCLYKKSLLCLLSFSGKNSNHIQKISVLSVNQKMVKQFIKDLARQANSDPQNAQLEIKNSKVSAFKLSHPGLQLNEDQSVKVIENYLRAKKHSPFLQLPFKKIKPEISTDSINNLGIVSLIGEGVSDFRGSSSLRIHNIEIGASRFNGALIKPKEEFSFVKILGAVDKNHGYLPELVIKRNETKPEFGGGICQVSTTAFRAAINSGLEITARTNHAYPVSYYNPQGMDATVYIPRPDLRFINNTPGYILIQTKIKGTKLIFDFYGTNDGRKVKIIGPKILQRKPDGSMKTTFTQQVFDQKGNLIREDIFNSNYASPNKYPHIIAKVPKKSKKTR